VARARSLLFESRAQRMSDINAPKLEDLKAYAAEVVHTVNAYLRAKGKRHLEAVVYPSRVVRGNVADGAPGIIAVRFAMVAEAPQDIPMVHVGANEEVDRLATLLRGSIDVEIPPYLNERRQLRIYNESNLFVLKPTEARYWTRVAGLNDADVILADHWMTKRHASIG